MDEFEATSDQHRVLPTILLLAGLGCAIGVIVSILAIGFLEGIAWMNTEFLIAPHARIQRATEPVLLNLATVLVPAAGGLVVGLMVRYFVNVRRPLGPPDTILVVQTRGTPQPVGSGLMSTLAAMISLGCGASVGQYGPLVYLGTIVGSLANKLKLKIPNLQAICIASGVAAAISVSFNAPIAGMVFAHEVILRHYAVKAFAPTTVAAAMGFIFANVVFDRPPLFLVVFEGVQHGYEFILFALVGILGALVAVGFSKVLLACQDFAGRTRIPAVFQPMVAGLVLGLVALQIPDVLGIGGATLRFATIEGAFQISELTLILITKAAVTILCLGFGFAGGVFSPIILIGILFGALFGAVLDQLQFIEHSGVVPYAICGMMALTSPVIGAPLAMILIIFELTRNYDLTIAAMVAVVFSNLLASRIFGRSIFDVQLRARGFDLTYGRTNAIIRYSSVTDIMQTEFPSFSPRDRVGEVASELAQIGRPTAVVVDDNRRAVGIAYVGDCTGQPPATRLEEVMNREVMRFNEGTDVGEALDVFQQSMYDIAPVVSSQTRELLGVVYENDVITEYSEITDRIRREENEPI